MATPHPHPIHGNVPPLPPPPISISQLPPSLPPPTHRSSRPPLPPLPPLPQPPLSPFSHATRVISSSHAMGPLPSICPVEKAAGPNESCNWIIYGHLLAGAYPGAKRSTQHQARLESLQHALLPMLRSTSTPNSARIATSSSTSTSTSSTSTSSPITSARMTSTPISKVSTLTTTLIEPRTMNTSTRPSISISTTASTSTSTSTSTSGSPTPLSTSPHPHTLTFINLMQVDELLRFQPYRNDMQIWSERNGIDVEFISFPIRDMSIHLDHRGLLQFILTLIHEYLYKGHLLYIHCWGGHGRTGILVSCILGIVYGLSAEDAMAACTRLHNCRISTRHQSSPHHINQFRQVIQLVSFYHAHASFLATGDLTFLDHIVIPRRDVNADNNINMTDDLCSYILSRRHRKIETIASVGITSSTSTSSRNLQSFTVMQWNTLADYLCDTTSFPHSRPDVLEWHYRAPLLIQEICRNAHKPDIICLEEVDHFYDFFVPELKRYGYDGIFMKKNEEGKSDGCALFYRTSHFQLLTHECITLESSRSQVIIIAQLQPIWDGVPVQDVCVYVLVMHLKAKGGHEQVRLNQGFIALNALQSFIARTQYEHVTSYGIVVCGDFNETMDNPVCQFFATGSASYGKVSGMKSKHKHKHRHEHGDDHHHRHSTSHHASPRRKDGDDEESESHRPHTAHTARTHRSHKHIHKSPSVGTLHVPSHPPRPRSSSSSPQSTPLESPQLSPVITPRPSTHHTTFTDSSTSSQEMFSLLNALVTATSTNQTDAIMMATSSSIVPLSAQSEEISSTTLTVPIPSPSTTSTSSPPASPSTSTSHLIHHPFWFHSVYERYAGLYHSLHGNAKPHYTTIKKRAGVIHRAIDYIWFSPDVFTPVSLLTMPDVTVELEPELLPSVSYPSDHLSLVCEFRWNTPSRMIIQPSHARCSL